MAKVLQIRCFTFHGVRAGKEFLRWVCSFRRRHHPVLLAKLTRFEGERILIRRRRDVRRFLNTIGPLDITTAT
jgi:hypothetical protein